MDYRIVLIFAGCVVGSMIQYILGFGCGTLLMVFLPSMYSLLQASALSSSVCILLTVSVAFRYRKYVSYKKLAVPCGLYLLASCNVIRLSTHLNLHFLVLAFGLFLVFLSFYFFFVKNKVSYSTNSLSVVVISLVSGAASGLFGIAGPMLAPYFLKATDSKEEYIGTMQTLFSFSTVVNFFARVRAGIYTIELVPATLCGFVGIVLGEIIGARIFARMNTELMSKLIYILIACSGILTIVTNI